MSSLPQLPSSPLSVWTAGHTMLLKIRRYFVLKVWCSHLIPACLQWTNSSFPLRLSFSPSSLDSLLFINFIFTTVLTGTILYFLFSCSIYYSDGNLLIYFPVACISLSNCFSDNATRLSSTSRPWKRFAKNLRYVTFYAGGDEMKWKKLHDYLKRKKQDFRFRLQLYRVGSLNLLLDSWHCFSDQRLYSSSAKSNCFDILFIFPGFYYTYSPFEKAIFIGSFLINSVVTVLMKTSYRLLFSSNGCFILICETICEKILNC